MRRRGNPRRDAVEYAVLLAVATSITAAFGVLTYIKWYEDEATNPRPTLDLNAPVNFQQALRELVQFNRNRQSQNDNPTRGKDTGDESK